MSMWTKKQADSEQAKKEARIKKEEENKARLLRGTYTPMTRILLVIEQEIVRQGGLVDDIVIRSGPEDDIHMLSIKSKQSSDKSTIYLQSADWYWEKGRPETDWSASTEGGWYSPNQKHVPINNDQLDKLAEILMEHNVGQRELDRILKALKS